MARQTIGIGQLDKFEVDENEQLFWKGNAVVLERGPIVLKGLERFLAILASVGAFAAGLHPFGVSFGWW